MGPLHPYGSVALGHTAADASRRLRDDDQLLRDAAVAAIGALTLQARRWGVATDETPGFRTRPTESDELGNVEVGWTGDEQRTGWPAMDARLLVLARPTGAARLALVAERPPVRGLAVPGMDPRHRQLLADTAMLRFLDEVAARILRSRRPATTDRPSADDRRPRFVHHLATVPGDAATISRELVLDALGLAEHGTRAALLAERDALAAGRFRAPAAPEVITRASPPDGLGVIELDWRCDEEATGWPELHLTIGVESWDGETRLVGLSTREPAYDLSRGRLDRSSRDHVLRHAAGGALTAIGEEIQERVAHLGVPGTSPDATVARHAGPHADRDGDRGENRGANGGGNRDEEPDEEHLRDRSEDDLVALTVPSGEPPRRVHLASTSQTAPAAVASRR